jgi:hypothetical protein
MDWLLERQGHIEKKLAGRHLRADGLVLYDLSSSYFEGVCCPLARYGHNRDGKRGKLQVNYGLVSAPGGCPVAVSVYECNTAVPPRCCHKCSACASSSASGAWSWWVTAG